MKRRTRRRNKRQQRSNAAKTQKPRARGPALNAEVLALRQALQSAKKTNQKLASLNTSLKKQVKKIPHMEISWLEEKRKLVHENRSLQRILGRKYIRVRNEINRLDGVLKVNETNKDFKEKENVKLQVALNAERERWRRREEKTTTELKEMHEKCREQEVVIMKKEKLITNFQKEMMTLTKEHLQTVIQLSQKENAHFPSERECQMKCEAPEVRLMETEREKTDREHDSKKEEKAT